MYLCILEEFLGYYNPMVNPAEVKLDAGKIQEWLAKGAQPTETVRAILKDHMPKAEA